MIEYGIPPHASALLSQKKRVNTLSALTHLHALYVDPRWARWINTLSTGYKLWCGSGLGSMLGSGGSEVQWVRWIQAGGEEVGAQQDPRLLSTVFPNTKYSKYCINIYWLCVQFCILIWSSLLSNAFLQEKKSHFLNYDQWWVGSPYTLLGSHWPPDKTLTNTLLFISNCLLTFSSLHV